jgi:hypothetical protein
MEDIEGSWIRWPGLAVGGGTRLGQRGRVSKEGRPELD